MDETNMQFYRELLSFFGAKRSCYFEINYKLKYALEKNITL